MTRKNDIEIEEVTWRIKNRILNNNRILLANKIKTDIFNLPIKELRLIHREKSISQEILLLFLSQFTGTIFAKNTGRKDYIVLNAKFMESNYGALYIKIIRMLIKNNFIYKSRNYKSDKNDVSSRSRSSRFKLNDKYIKEAKYKSYILKEKRVNKLRLRITTKAIERAQENIIAKETLIMYGLIQLPNINHLIKVGKELVKNKKSKKGKIYRMRNKKSKKFDKPNSRYIEDDIYLFKFLVEPSMFVPSISNNAGGRVTHSLNLCPSWIRNEITMKMEDIVEIDYKALHPNIASSLYGVKHHLNHEIVGNELGYKKKEIKTEHLSFFNKTIWQMKHSLLYDFYKRYEPELLQNVEFDKSQNGPLSVTKKLFTIESKLITEVIEILNKEFIFPIYVYDALLVNKEDSLKVQEIMNLIANKNKIPTFAEIK